MFTGLSAFPLTPLTNDSLDERSYVGLIERLRDARVDSITALGSTGSYAYLTHKERRRVAHLAVRHAGSVPVFVGVGALRTSHVLANVEAAEEAGASGVLLAPMTYQPLTEDDVFELFHTVTSHSSLPVIVYDNPATTHFTFHPGLYGRIAQLPGVASIKIPGSPNTMHLEERVREIRSLVPDHVTLGISGDANAAAGLSAGCDAWYSVIGGTLPGIAQRITHAAINGRPGEAASESERLAPLWQLFADFGGSLRVVAAIAEQLGLASTKSLPLPIQGLGPEQRARVAGVIEELGLGT
ncbi:4-hydroxy-tetrahydrodipicolinate synthase [Pseudarthrobacter sp. PvP004]|uniref:dihydrodipicolinate synthase family protein n=1 Tax=Pseudarthrobacter sp. PvP004 TaxID=2817850 RepID=UPI001AE78A2E|nr:dihydrodipicolinate synthase family protein [Pseudarthrobacter sp. PvP004]MBP2268480.1 4-hydroxy-tetrahydrodipicolinate synthase [Pseudarthrobacter sp. PvP004]